MSRTAELGPLSRAFKKGISRTRIMNPAPVSVTNVLEAVAINQWTGFFPSLTGYAKSLNARVDVVFHFESGFGYTGDLSGHATYVVAQSDPAYALNEVVTPFDDYSPGSSPLGEFQFATLSSVQSLVASLITHMTGAAETAWNDGLSSLGSRLVGDQNSSTFTDENGNSLTVTVSLSVLNDISDAFLQNANVLATMTLGDWILNPTKSYLVSGNQVAFGFADFGGHVAFQQMIGTITGGGSTTYSASNAPNVYPSYYRLYRPPQYYYPFGVPNDAPGVSDPSFGTWRPYPFLACNCVITSGLSGGTIIISVKTLIQTTRGFLDSYEQTFTTDFGNTGDSSAIATGITVSRPQPGAPGYYISSPTDSLPYYTNLGFPGQLKYWQSLF